MVGHIRSILIVIELSLWCMTLYLAISCKAIRGSAVQVRRPAQEDLSLYGQSSQGGPSSRTARWRGQQPMLRPLPSAQPCLLPPRPLAGLKRQTGSRAMWAG